MKYLIWIGLVVVILLVMRLLSPVKRRDDEAGKGNGGAAAGRARGGRAATDAADRARDADDRRGGRELMLRCTVCGVHIPSSDAVFARGRVYCGVEHRDVDAGRDRSNSDRS